MYIWIILLRSNVYSFQGLRSNLLGKHKDLQLLPVVCETGEHKEKKARFEKEIEEIEKNIYLLSNYDVFVEK